MNPKVWEASGHIKGFHDIMVECRKCHKRYRKDHIVVNSKSDILNPKLICPSCGSSDFSNEKKFNLMFKSFFGPTEGSENVVYLRPETAQGIFINFALVQETMRLKLPFGIAQIGKAFRNEITTGNFIFRVREFEQMEMEWFCKPSKFKSQNKEDKSPEEWFSFWVEQRYNWYIQELGIKRENLNLKKYKKEELAHYSSSTTDIEYNFPFGFGEIEGIALRTDFDLRQHEKFSQKNLKYFDESLKTSFIPYVIEPSCGVERIFLAVLCDAYNEEEISPSPNQKEVDKRIVLKLKPTLSPIKIAVLPLLKNKPELVQKATEIYHVVKEKFGMVMYDDAGAIGRRYRRQDEIGTPYCLTIDFETLKNESFTIRDRDTMKQQRIVVKDLDALKI
jgi:glycyl-tRNA synthetase